MHCYLVGCYYLYSFIISCYGMHLQLMVVLIECFVTCCLCICLSESDCYKHQFTAGCGNFLFGGDLSEILVVNLKLKSIFLYLAHQKQKNLMSEA